MKKYKFIYVYLTMNLSNGKIYIGVHRTNVLQDSYIGSGKLLKIAIKKYGKENFRKIILKQFDNIEDAMSFEKYLVDDAFVKSPITYNVRVGGGVDKVLSRSDINGKNNPFYGKTHTEETKLTIADKTRKLKSGVKLKDKHRKAISEALKRKTFSKERCENISKAKKGKPAYNKGVKFTTQIVCPVCGKIGTNPSNMTRWHFKNCKGLLDED